MFELKEAETRQYREEFYHWMLWSKLGIAPESLPKTFSENSATLASPHEVEQHAAAR